MILSPVRQLHSFRFRELTRHFHHLGPLVGLLDDLEARCRIRISNLPKLNLDKKKPEIAVGMLIEPLDSLLVLISRVGNYPDNDLSILSSSVCNDFIRK